jgi:hypothetical protein
MISFKDGYYGWLGNQMFQYAATFALSKRMGVSCAFPAKSPNLHDIFPLSANIREHSAPILREAGFHFSPLPIDVKDLVLHGYFQSEKYFEDCREEVKKEFSFRNPQQFTLLENTVSIHVRRGDYMKHPNHHPLCSMDYYNRAMSEFKGYNFLVCTDDKKWCKENFKQDNVQVSLLEDASQELELMSWCEHHIIANSSFSWWSAWLGHNKDKRVVAPAKWFGPAYSHMQTQDLYVEDWLVI